MENNQLNTRSFIRRALLPGIVDANRHLPELAKLLKHALWLSIAVLVPLLAEPGWVRAQGLGTQFDSMPILTTRLVLVCRGTHSERTVVGSSWVRAIATRTDGQVTDFFVHMPGGASPVPSTTLDTRVLGLQLPGIARVGDIAKLEFELPELACVDDYYILFNDRFTVAVENAVGTVPGRNAFPPSRNSRPGPAIVFGVVKSYIQSEAARQDRTSTCELPLRIYPETVQATLTSMLGNLIIRTEDSYFSNDDYVVIVGEGENVKVEFTVHSSKGSARLLFDLGITCAPSQPTAADPNPTGSSISLEVGQVTAQEIDGSDALTTIAAELGIAQGILENQINAQLDGLRNGMGELVRNLPLCPSIGFQKTAAGDAEPSVIIQGIPFYPPSLVIDAPDLTALGLPPITLCN